jgi:aminopeptidase N
MDEGFTTFAQYTVLDSIYRNGSSNPLERQMNGVVSLQLSGLAEPASTHADHYHTNYAYGITSYHKGAVFLRQLQYIVGKENFWKGMTRYFNDWGFKHPTPNDFIRVMEKISGMELSWYLDLYIGTVKFSDYGIKDVRKRKKGMATVDLERIGQMPMPVDVRVTDKDGNEMLYHIPLSIMRGEKPNEGGKSMVVLEDWPWTHPDYSIDLAIKKRKVKSIEIDPTVRMVDINRDNNHYPEVKK